MKTSMICTLFVAFVAVAWLRAEDAPPPSQAEKEHALLKQFVGEWEWTMTAKMAPDQPETKCQGTVRSRMLGDLWVISELKADMMGMPMQAVQTIGYDPAKKKYVGTWVDSMYNHLWKYEGTVDAASKALHLDAEGPNFLEPGKTSLFRDSYAFKSADVIVQTSSMQGPDGKWIVFMSAELKRKK